jgi:4-amino-4-deoxy-L-arabinose transferase-like glycosyltransferase
MREGLRKAATSLLFIAVVALAGRTAFAVSQVRKIQPQVLRIIAFQTETGHIAYSLVTGKGFSSPFQRDSGPTVWLTPVYPFLVALIFKVFGIYTIRAVYAAVFLNILFSVATCVPIFYVGRRVGGLLVASVAAWLWAIYPNGIMMPFEWIWDTSLAALLGASLLWATIDLAESQSLRNWCLYGLLWGFTLMTSPALGSLLPFFLGWIAYRSPLRGRPRLVRPALAVAIIVLCCVPWTIRNYVVFHRFIPFRSNFPFELYSGNNENYDERRIGFPAQITQDREILRYLRLGETAFMDDERRKAMAFITSHPRTEVWLFANRIVDFWLGTATPVQAFRIADSPLLYTILICNFIAPFGALLGIIVLLLKRNPYAFPLVIVPAVFPVLYYITHTSLRYRHPIDPVVLLLFAIGVAGVEHHRKPVAPVAI